MNKTQNFWDNQAGRFDSLDDKFKNASLQLIARTKEFLDPGDVVLDFGCATGNKTLKLADGIKHIHGLDFSGGMISEAMNKKNISGIMNASFSQGTIFNNDFGNSFDKIVAYSIIHLLDDCEQVIKRINELLKPGGLFISETPCFKEKMKLKTRLEVNTFLLMKKIWIFPLHLNMFKTTGLEKLIEKQNFKINTAETIFYNGMTISFIVAEKL